MKEDPSFWVTSPASVLVQMLYFCYCCLELTQQCFQELDTHCTHTRRFCS
jgi:hypothetical protein